MRIDLDAAKAARREASGEAPIVVFGGKEFTLPVELPQSAAEAINDVSNDKGSVNDIFKILLNGQFSDFMALGPSVDDVKEFFDKIAPVYGVASTGESQASGASS